MYCDGTRIVYIIFFFFSLTFCSRDTTALVFVHLGEKLPSHASYAFIQARKFNEFIPIYLIVNKGAEKEYSKVILDNDIKVIYCEDLVISSEHNKFHVKSPLQGFWKKTIERFFYLDSFMKKYNLKNVFHIENDILIYIDLKKMLPIFQQAYKGIAAPFDNDNRCIPSFVYFPNKESITDLISFISEHAQDGLYDMQAIALYKKKFSDKIENLPIVVPEYAQHNVLKNKRGDCIEDTSIYSKNFERFQSIFDAAALGQYLGGIDSIHGYEFTDFVNESCIFDPSLFCFEWNFDYRGRKIPWIVYQNKKYRINNLHIHSKKLYNFLS